MIISFRSNQVPRWFRTRHCLTEIITRPYLQTSHIMTSWTFNLPLAVRVYPKQLPWATTTLWTVVNLSPSKWEWHPKIEFVFQYHCSIALVLSLVSFRLYDTGRDLIFSQAFVPVYGLDLPLCSLRNFLMPRLLWNLSKDIDARVSTEWRQCSLKKWILQSLVARIGQP